MSPLPDRTWDMTINCGEHTVTLAPHESVETGFKILDYLAQQRTTRAYAKTHRTWDPLRRRCVDCGKTEAEIHNFMLPCVYRPAA